MDFAIRSTFGKLEGTQLQSIPASSLLKAGELIWQGNIKAREPVVVSATVQFPEPGKWKIHIEGNSRSNELNHMGGYGATIELTVGNDLSYYGWVKLLPRR